MNSKVTLSSIAVVVAALAAVASGVARADEADGSQHALQFTSTRTRAEVQAEFLEARKNGTLLETEADFDVAQTRKHTVAK